MEEWLAQEFERTFERVTGITKLTYREKRDECDEIFRFLTDLLLMSDMGELIYREEGAGIPYYISALTVRTYLEFQANLFQGAYHSAGRSLRWLYEANLVGATACIEPSLLAEQFRGKESIKLNEFEKWLSLYDKRRRLERSKILEALGLPREEYKKLYSDLCEYSHISKISFAKELDFPKLQYIYEKFDEIFALTRKTLDLVLWLECNMFLQYDEGTKEALRNCREGIGSLISQVPMTMKLLSRL